MNGVVLTLEEAEQLAVDVLVKHRTSPTNAAQVARALVGAEADGQTGHGLSRLPSYTAQSATGKVDGFATPEVESLTPALARIDARRGFAYPALAKAVDMLCDSTPRTLVAAAAVWNSHHCGVLGYHVERLARCGLVALMVANTPKAIAPWGGRDALFGTNPIAFAAPRPGAEPIVVDMSLSKVARGKIMLAAREGRAIPEGWAVDPAGRPTTDPEAALEGSVLPFGDPKGAALALVIEVLAAALTGARLGLEASSFFTGVGDPPAVGQLLIAFSPQPVSGGRFDDRLHTLVTAISAQPGARLPGAHRDERRARAQAEGIVLSPELHRELEALAGR